jgi:hypothetical protein
MRSTVQFDPCSGVTRHAACQVFATRFSLPQFNVNHIYPEKIQSSGLMQTHQIIYSGRSRIVGVGEMFIRPTSNRSTIPITYEGRGQKFG